MLCKRENGTNADCRSFWNAVARLCEGADHQSASTEKSRAVFGTREIKRICRKIEVQHALPTNFSRFGKAVVTRRAKLSTVGRHSNANEQWRNRAGENGTRYNSRHYNNANRAAARAGLARCQTRRLSKKLLRIINLQRDAEPAIVMPRRTRKRGGKPLIRVGRRQ